MFTKIKAEDIKPGDFIKTYIGNDWHDDKGNHRLEHGYCYGYVKGYYNKKSSNIECHAVIAADGIFLQNESLGMSSFIEKYYMCEEEITEFKEICLSHGVDIDKIAECI